MWAASNMNSAPTSSAIARNGSGSMTPRVGGGAGDDHLRAVLEGEVADLVEVDALVARASTP